MACRIGGWPFFLELNRKRKRVERSPLVPPPEPYAETYLVWGHALNFSYTYPDMPTNGETIYVRLTTNYNGTWVHNDYRFTAAE